MANDKVFDQQTEKKRLISYVSIVETLIKPIKYVNIFDYNDVYASVNLNVTLSNRWSRLAVRFFLATANSFTHQLIKF